MSVRCKICGADMALFIADIFDDRHGYPGRFDIFKCGNCGFRSTHPELTGADLDDLYTKYYPRQNLNADQVKAMVLPVAGFKARASLWAKGLDNSCHFRAKPGMKVLDYGCGTGASLLEIESLGAEAFGVEVDKNIEPIAKELNLQIHFGPIETCSFPDNSFDLITLNQVLEHVADPAALLSQLKKKIKSGGKIMLSFPNPGSVSRRALGRRWLHWHVPYHINHFSKKSVGLLLGQVGLRVLEIKTITPNAWTLLQVRSLFEKTEEGSRVGFWDVDKIERAAQANERPFPRKVFAKLFNLAATRGKIILTPYNRIFDLMGLGESVVVTAVPSSDKSAE